MRWLRLEQRRSARCPTSPDSSRRAPVTLVHATMPLLIIHHNHPRFRIPTLALHMSSGLHIIICSKILMACAAAHRPSLCGYRLALRSKLAIPAYEGAIQASHIFNTLQARGVISVAERQAYIGRVRDLAKAACASWMETNGWA